MILSIEHLTKYYGKKLALSDFSAEFGPGIHALLGPNGSGKSTLMNIITQNLNPTGGNLLFDGKSAKKMGKKYRAKLGFMPQYPGMYPSFGVEEFLWYIASLKGIKKEEARRAIPEVLKAVELEDVAKSPIRTLSGGMKQRLALAQATLGNPDILILDEPTAGLDPKQRIAIRNYISSIAMQKIVIIATHIVSDIESIASDVYVLKNGILFAEDSAAALASTMEGKVGTLRIPEEQLGEYEKKYRIVNMVKNETDITIRILCDSGLPEGAVPCIPGLEDYYLSIF